jgi:pyruvate-formate lyase-activating enzyme
MRGEQMDLASLMSLRPVPGAGLLVALTRRCPLSCAHCSTASTMSGGELDAGRLRRFVETFTPADRPDVVMFTGGEPLLRLRLLTDLSASAQAAGSASAVLTGAFFARGGRVPPHVLRALLALDHVSISVDAFHEREVPRADVFSALRTLLAHGQDVSLHVVGSGPADPYLAQVTAEVAGAFGRQVPMLVSQIRAVGRAAAWSAAQAASSRDDDLPLPCAMAAWPVIAFDGVITACCEQIAVDIRPLPAHLALGDAMVDGWAAVRRRALASPMLRLIRAVGPVCLSSRFGGPDRRAAPVGYCATCRGLSSSAGLADTVRHVAAGPAGELLDREAARMQREAGAVALVRRYGVAAYAGLVAP